MTDRYMGLTVVFDHDIREDDAEGLMAGIGYMKGVLQVTPVVADAKDHINRERVYYEMREKILRSLRPWGEP